ncbi:MAG: L-threonylcarbamoyladenylate synthase, partial [Rhizobiaceae bacterium]|nr:L-threonylcarbamoyladenylate synthase [Rhizobiaceae bacterium]
MARHIDILKEPEAAISAAVNTLSEGLPIGLPTETVYGLAADATNPAAITRIYETKGRPRFNPLICHMSDLAMAERYAIFDPISMKLAEAFWPGPLTLVVPLKPDSGIHPLATAGLDTVGIRVPQGFAG